MKIAMSRKKAMTALERWPQKDKFSTDTFLPTMGFGDTVTLDSGTVPREFLQFLLDDVGTLSDRQRSKLYIAVHGVGATIDMICAKPADVQTMIAHMRVQGGYNAEVYLNGRWYPIMVTSQLHPAHDYRPTYCTITIKAKICDPDLSRYGQLSPIDFTDDAGEPSPVSGVEILRWFNLRHVQQDTLDYDRKRARAEAFLEFSGKVMAIKGSVLTSEKPATSYGSPSFAEMELGTREVPKKLVIDGQLEAARDRHTNADNDKSTVLPFVRGFSMDLKRWVYADVDDLAEYNFDDRALEWLVLPTNEKSILTRLFSAARSDLFGDVLHDKHGGMIILANGPTGVGKTLTAEVFAEITHAPLYVMEMAELGIDVAKIEENLARIFRRVTRWKAILLMDEADIFLAQRDTNLARSAIVGIFLRLMDYYKGLLFLTSNRADVIDDAFKSRITIRVDYPELTEEGRREIWHVMLRHAAIIIVESDPTKPLERPFIHELAKVPLNGRQIRNMVRLIKVLYGDHIPLNKAINACQFACR